MGERRDFWLRSLREREHLETVDVHGRIILKWISGKLGICVSNRT